MTNNNKIILGNPRSERAMEQLKTELEKTGFDFSASGVWFKWYIYGRNTVVLLDGDNLLYTTLEDEERQGAERFTASSTLDTEMVKTYLNDYYKELEEEEEQRQEQHKAEHKKRNKVIYTAVHNQTELDLAIKEAQEQGYKDPRPEKPKKDLYKRLREKEPYGAALLVKRYHGHKKGYLWQLSTDAIERHQNGINRRINRRKKGMA